MNYDFKRLSKDTITLKSKQDFELYLESNFIEIENNFLHISSDEIDKIKFDIEDFLYDLLDNKFISKENTKIVNAFLILLAEKFLQTSMIGAITIIFEHLPKSSIKYRLDAAKLYLRVNDISKDYFNRFEPIFSLLQESANIDEYNIKATKSLLYFYQIAMRSFKRINSIDFAIEFKNRLNALLANYNFSNSNDVKVFLHGIHNLNIDQTLEQIQQYLEGTFETKSFCTIEDTKLSKENSEYTNALYELKDPNFTSIRHIAYQYLQSIGDPIELYDKLQRGEKIIDDVRLLSKYLVSFGVKHKDKLYSAYDEIINKISTEKCDIIDWGCGQATATMLLLNYAKEKNIQLDIENITLIEPSQLALSRGLVHIDLLKQQDYTIKVINIDIDCLQENDLKTKSLNKTIHLFSNILDIESFTLDNSFFKKVTSSFNGDAIFVCVSPNRNDKQNNRLDLFYKYFDENFDTKLLASRDTSIGSTTRYEKVFEVIATPMEIIVEQRNEIEKIQKSNHINIIEELEHYRQYLIPIIDMKLVKDIIATDPEYLIFKLRKVADTITSKLYANYESNGSLVSFNDKIRYLSFEKKLFDKTITNYVHTVRTIGNRGVHDEVKDLHSLKFDAYLMALALISFIKALKNNKIIE